MVVIGSVLAGAVAAVLSGQDAGFDVRNYHWYDAWAVLHGRYDLDVAPAQLQSFFNPALDVLYYACIAGIGGVGGAAVLGGLHGLVPGLAGCLALRLLPADQPGRLVLAAAVSTSAVIAPVFLAEVGASHGDLPVAALVLGGVLALLGSSPRSPVVWGALTGLALGLKPTVAPFVLAGIPVLAARFGVRSLAIAGIAGASGWVIGGGWWAALLLIRTGNPFFPMLNDVFQSDWAAHEHFFDQGYFPSGVDWVLLPFRMAQGGEVSWFYEWRDARLGVLLLLGVGVALRDRHRTDLHLALMWGAVAYLLWLRSSAMVRYLAPLEAAAPALIVASSVRMVQGRLGRAGALGALILLALWMRPAEYERIPWSEPALQVRLPPLPSGPAPVIVTAGDAANSYLAPSFPPAWRHVRIVSSVLWHEDETLLHHKASEILKDGDPVLFLTGQDGESMPDALLSFGRRADMTRCAPVLSPFDEGVLLCPTKRLSP